MRRVSFLSYLLIVALIVSACSAEPVQNTEQKYSTDEQAPMESSAANDVLRVQPNIDKFMELQALEDKGPPPVICAAPKAADGTEIVLLSGYQGQAISTAAVSGLDTLTSVAVLTIEDGEAPLYILATAYDAIVWQVTGATQRVRNFVVQPLTPNNIRGAGVVGLDPDVVSFVASKACMPRFDNTENENAVEARSMMAEYLAKDIDHIIGYYELDQILLPSGLKDNANIAIPDTMTTTPDGRRYLHTRSGWRLLDPNTDESHEATQGSADIQTQYNLSLYHPEGVKDINAAKVLAAYPVEDYDVLPQEAGLVQLMDAGAISLTDGGLYRIEKPIARYPAGLHGPHKVTFLIADGVTIPAGDPGHSTVILESTGQCVSDEDPCP